MNSVTKFFVAILAIAGIVVASPLVPNANAAGVDVFKGCTSSTSAVCNAKGDKAPDIIKNIINLLLFVLGMIAVIMIVIGGIRYTTSNGDSGQVKSAKDTILYSVVGLVVAIMAFAIVNFVLDAFS